MRSNTNAGESGSLLAAARRARAWAEAQGAMGLQLLSAALCALSPDFYFMDRTCRSLTSGDRECGQVRRGSSGNRQVSGGRLLSPGNGEGLTTRAL